MAIYKIELKKSAEKEIDRLDKNIIPQIFHKIRTLAENPYPSQSLKLAGSGYSYRLRVGDYRILYQIDNSTKIITIFAVGHRKDIYRK